MTRKLEWLTLPDGTVEHRSATIERLGVARAQIEAYSGSRPETVQAMADRLAMNALRVFEANLNCEDEKVQRMAARDIIWAYDKIKRYGPLDEPQTVVTVEDRKERRMALFADPPPELEEEMRAGGWERKR